MLARVFPGQTKATPMIDRALTFRAFPRLEWSRDHLWGTWLWWEFSRVRTPRAKLDNPLGFFGGRKAVNP